VRGTPFSSTSLSTSWDRDKRVRGTPSSTRWFIQRRYTASVSTRQSNVGPLIIKIKDGTGKMEHKSVSNTENEQIRQKWDNLKKLAFPESPGHPFLDNLYIELAEYDVYVCGIAASILEKGAHIDRESIRVDEDWNNKLDTFDSSEKDANQACSDLRQYKQALDDLLICIVSSPV
jgi:hypothetical protein